MFTASKQTKIKDAVVRARVDSDLKNKVDIILHDLGLTISEAISLYLSQIKLHKGIPFAIEIPNKETKKAIHDAQNGKNVTICKDSKDMFQKLGI